MTAAAARAGPTNHRLRMALSPFVGPRNLVVSLLGEALRVVCGNPAQQFRQASQLGELMTARCAARQVSIDSAAVVGLDSAEDVDPQLEADHPACLPRSLTDQGVLQRGKRRTET